MSRGVDPEKRNKRVARGPRKPVPTWTTVRCTPFRLAKVKGAWPRPVALTDLAENECRWPYVEDARDTVTYTSAAASG